MKFTKLFFALSCSLIIFSCQTSGFINKSKQQGMEDYPYREETWFSNLKDQHDPYGNLERSDYKETVAKTAQEPDSSLVEPKLKLPEMSNLLLPAEEPVLVNDKLVSISVNETVPLKDVIIELARRAEVDVEVDKDINGGIILIAKNRPFSEVIDRISKMAGLRYSFDDGILKIEKDAPALKNYKFNLLDLVRTSSGNVTTSTSIGSGSAGGGGGGGGGAGAGGGAGGGGGSSSGGAAISSGSSTGGSASSVSYKSGDGDIWANIKDGINQLLSKYGNEGSSNEGGPNNTSTSPGGQGQNSNVNTGNSGIIGINKNAGIISVLATERQHKAIKEFLDKLHIELTSQVLIEAKVVEVTLNDEYSSGINWSLVNAKFGTTGGFGAAPGYEPDYTDPEYGLVTAATANSGFNLILRPTSFFGGDNFIGSTIRFLQTFGTTRSLSNPRISTLNNQFAVLNFSRNLVYFGLSSDESETTDVSNPTAGRKEKTITTTIYSVPVGVVLTLQPSIDLAKNEVLMNVRPTLSKSDSSVEDPGAAIIAANANLTDFTSEIPIVETRQLDTTMRIKSGEIMVIGGLLEERTENIDTGVPGLADIPYLGNAFKSVSKITSNVETVIFIKATIVPGQGVSVQDEEFFKKFTSGRRKLQEYSPEIKFAD